MAAACNGALECRIKGLFQVEAHSEHQPPRAPSTEPLPAIHTLTSQRQLRLYHTGAKCEFFGKKTDERERKVGRVGEL